MVPGLGTYTMSYYTWCHRLTALHSGASSSALESGVSITAQHRCAFALEVYDLPHLALVRGVTAQHRCAFALEVYDLPHLALVRGVTGQLRRAFALGVYDVPNLTVVRVVSTQHWCVWCAFTLGVNS